MGLGELPTIVKERRSSAALATRWESRALAPVEFLTESAPHLPALEEVGSLTCALGVDNPLGRAAHNGGRAALQRRVSHTLRVAGFSPREILRGDCRTSSGFREKWGVWLAHLDSTIPLGKLTTIVEERRFSAALATG